MRPSKSWVFPENEISLCFAFDDAPPLVLIDLDMPEGLAGEEALFATAAREQLMQSLQELGCPTGPSSNPERRRAAVLLSDPDSYGGKKQVWSHPRGLAVELYTPGSLAHAKPYALDGDLPTIESAALTELLQSQSFELPETRRGGGGGGGANSKKKDKVDFFAHGEAWARGLKDPWAFDAYGGGYHQWQETHWHNMPNTADTEDCLWERLQRETVDFDLRTDLQANRGEVLRGVRAALRRHLPLVKGDDLAVANGVVHLPTGDLRGFDSAVDSHRAVTGGAYRQEWSEGQCWGIVMIALHPRRCSPPGHRGSGNHHSLLGTGNQWSGTETYTLAEPLGRQWRREGRHDLAAQSGVRRKGHGFHLGRLAGVGRA